MFLVCLVLKKFLIVCCNTPNPTKKAITLHSRVVKTILVSRQQESYLESVVTLTHL